MKSVAVPALGLGGRVPSLGSRALVPLIVRGHVNESALAVTRHAPPLPICHLIDPGRGLLTTTGTDRCARALRATVRGRSDCAHNRLAITRPGVAARGHTGSATGHVTVAGLVTALLLTARGLGRGVGGLDGVAGIAGRLLLLPAIAETLG